MPQLPPAEVFAPREIARAAGVAEDAVLLLIRTGAIQAVPTRRGGEYVDSAEAIRTVRALSSGRPVGGNGAPVFSPVPRKRKTGTPFAASSLAHLAVLGLALTLGGGRSTPQAKDLPQLETRLVFLTSAAPAGGGGGGGEQAKAPPRQAQRRGSHRVDSPVPPVVTPPAPTEASTPAPQATVEAPVVPLPADEEETTGVLDEVPEAAAETRGPGTDDGAGTGAGVGTGDGSGNGLGAGHEAGTGGGPYRPGSGVQPPRLLREVKPHYTEEARSKGIQGDVLLEIVVRRDGSVGEARILRGLGHGLDTQALAAVRQWEFAPAQRFDVRVDVIVEVAMEFRLR
jgi:protein TonB